MRAWRAAYSTSTRGLGGGSYRATKVFYRGECYEDIWVPTGGMAPLSWRFWVGLVLASVISGISSSLVWVKITVGWMVTPISPSDTTCIISSSLMCPARSSVLDDLVGNVC